MRVASYVRVSSEEQVDGYSLSAQERAIETYCRLHEYDVVAQYRDEGKSARTDKLENRPAFQKMLLDADLGQFDLVVVHKLDRFARNLRVTLETLDRLEKAGVSFTSVSENVDFSTPMGKVILSTMGGFAQFYSDNLSQETKKGKHERKRQGLYNGLLPFGSRKGPQGIPVLDEEPRWCDVATRTERGAPAQGLVLAFELAAAGKTDREVAQALNEAGYRTSGNRGANPFSKDTVRVILTNRFYLGELPDGDGGWVAGRHNPMVELSLFEAAQQAREANTNRPRRISTIRSPWALSGVAICAECGESIIVHGGSGGRRRLRCAGRAQGSGCEQPSFFAEEAEAQMAMFLDTFSVPSGIHEQLIEAWKQHHRASGDVTAEKQRLRRKLNRLRELYLDGDLDKPSFQQQKAAITDALASLPAEAESDDTAVERLAGFLTSVSSAWEVATPEERNRLARHMFADAIIENKTVVAVKPRPEFAPFFDVVKEGYGGSDGIRCHHRVRLTATTSLPTRQKSDPWGVRNAPHSANHGRQSSLWSSYPSCA